MAKIKETSPVRHLSKNQLLRELSKVKGSVKKLGRIIATIPEEQPLLLHVNEHEAVELQEYLDQYRKGTLPW